MGKSLRTGAFGTFYGNDYNSSSALTYDEMNHNAKYIYSALTTKGWTINAIAALLGNMQVESSLNPGRWQSDRVGGSSEGHGYSLVQWTPYTKYTEWCNDVGLYDPSHMDSAIARINYEVENDIQWIGLGDFYGVSFREFSSSMMSPSTLAKAFMICYERPADQSEEAQNYRGELAMSWYEYLKGVTPSDPSEGSKKGKRKYNFILFNARKRKNLWIRTHS